MVFDFISNKQKLEVAQRIHSIINHTTPNRPIADCQRFELRYNRTLPILLTPWRDGAAVVAETSIGFTRDLSNQGAGLIALKELQEEKFVVTIAPPAGSVEPPYHFVAHLRGINPMALGLWIAHLEFEQSVSGKGSNLPELDDVAKKALLPILEEAAEPTSV